MRIQTLCLMTAILCLAMDAAAQTSFSKLSQTFVGPTKGNDSDACTQAKPCRTIKRAMENTKDAGTVILLEAREENGKCKVVYDRDVTITRSVNIVAAAGLAAKPCFIPRPSASASDRTFTIEGANIMVTLNSLKVAESGGNVAVYFNDGANLKIVNCDFDGQNHGIVYNGGKLLRVSHSHINASMAIWLTDKNTTKKTAIIQDCKFDGHTDLPHYVFQVDKHGQVTISNSTIDVQCPVAMLVAGTAALNNVQITRAERAFEGTGKFELRSLTIN